MISKIRKLLPSERGLSLLEMVVAIGIIGLLSTGLSSITYSLGHHVQSNRAHVTAATSIEEAARQISQDWHRSQMVNLIAGDCPVEAVTLSWIDPTNGDTYEIFYSLAGQNLIRTESVNSVMQSQRTVGRYFTGANFSQPASGLYLMRLSSSGGSARVAEEREYYVTLRAGD